MRSPETARSIKSERINPPSKSVDKTESAPLLETLLLWRAQNTPRSLDRQIALTSMCLGVSENSHLRKFGFREWRLSETGFPRTLLLGGRVSRVAVWLLPLVASYFRPSRANQDNVLDRYRINVLYLPILIVPKMLSGAATLAGVAEQTIRRRTRRRKGRSAYG